ncbi:MAG: SPASM domain-containing protein [Spirochaetales bacterium]|nr:SPASM domain-containing protein [Spirochaetales bacterium]
MNGEIPYVLSEHTIIGKIRDASDYYLINLLTGGAAIVPEETALSISKGNFQNQEDLLVRKGFLLNKEDEKIMFINAYLDFSKRQSSSRMDLFLIPWYTDGAGLPIKGKDEKMKADEPIRPEVVDAFFRLVDSRYRNRKKRIVICGGEPFLTGDTYESIIDDIMTGSAERGIKVSFSTNGLTLSEYPIRLEPGATDEIHILFDMEGAFAKEGGKTPDIRSSTGIPGLPEKTASGIDEVLSRGIPLCLDIRCRRQDLKGLHTLAAFTFERGWTENEFFRARLGNRRHIFYCPSENEIISSDESFLSALYETVIDYPEILELLQPFRGISYELLQKKELPPPSFDACPAIISSLTCDHTGKLFLCPLAAIESKSDIGRYYPEESWNEAEIDRYKDRDITTITECRLCSYRLACGGGCPLNARTGHGNPADSDCRPVAVSLDAGMSLYFEKKVISS